MDLWFKARHILAFYQSSHMHILYKKISTDVVHATCVQQCSSCHMHVESLSSWFDPCARGGARLATSQGFTR
jgi:hypothetical protein